MHGAPQRGIHILIAISDALRETESRNIFSHVQYFDLDIDSLMCAS